MNPHDEMFYGGPWYQNQLNLQPVAAPRFGLIAAPKPNKYAAVGSGVAAAVQPFRARVASVQVAGAAPAGLSTGAKVLLVAGGAGVVGVLGYLILG